MHGMSYKSLLLWVLLGEQQAVLFLACNCFGQLHFQLNHQHYFRLLKALCLCWIQLAVKEAQQTSDLEIC